MTSTSLVLRVVDAAPPTAPNESSLDLYTGGPAVLLLPELVGNRWVFGSEARYRGGRGPDGVVCTKSGFGLRCAFPVRDPDSALFYGYSPRDHEVAKTFSVMRKEMRGQSGIKVNTQSSKRQTPFIEVTRLEGETRDALNDRAGDLFAGAIKRLLAI